MSARVFAVASSVVVLCVTGCGSSKASPPLTSPPVDPVAATSPMTGTVRIAYLHHSTGGNVWEGGVPEAIAAWNAAHGTDYRIAETWYPASTDNMPYDFWRHWVSGGGAALDALAADNEVIVFKHCFPVSDLEADDGAPSVSSARKTPANYRLQYAALRDRMRAFPGRRFVVWTGPALTAAATTPAAAGRARDFAAWVTGTWDEAGDNVYVWDFRELETSGGLYLPDGNAAAADDSHPNGALAALAGPLAARRIIDVIEGRGDAGSLTGR